jgi:hypothetical protein
VYIVVISYKK